MHFVTLATRLYHDMGPVCFDRLNGTDQRALFAAYLRDHPVLLYGLLVKIDAPKIVEDVAVLVGTPDLEEALRYTDMAEIVVALRRAIFPNKDIARAIQRELDELQSGYVPQLEDGPFLQRQAG